MLSLFGQISLFLALIFSLLQSILPLWGYYRENLYALAGARPSALAQFFFILLAYLLLTFAFIRNDFSLAYVQANSHLTLPFIYKLTAVWGAHEGSILLWILLLNVWTLFAMKIMSADKHFLALVLAIIGVISACFISFLLFTSNPFLPMAGATQGMDLNPLLQDPGFIIHPPMLYMGYVGFSVTFAIAFAGLLKHQPLVPVSSSFQYPARENAISSWIKIIRYFAISSWCFLTFGILLGSWWAYHVLGWGGFWFWDPVENASLLPWLTGTALIHVLILADKRGIATNWAILLAMLSFVLSILSTFLVRSGILISAHTFANDPARGIFLLLLLAILIIAIGTIYLFRAPKNIAAFPHFAFLSREMALLLNSALLLLSMLTILLGTLYPLILDSIQLGTISVGAPYFNTVMLPIVFILMLLISFAALCGWREEKKIWQKSYKKILLSILCSWILQKYFFNHFNMLAFLGLSLSILIIVTHFPTYLNAMFFAHTGFAIFMLGIILSGYLSQEKELQIKPGEVTDLGPYQFVFIRTQPIKRDHYAGIRAHFAVLKNKYPITQLFPEKRIYQVRQMLMTKVAIHPGIFRDLYIALGEPLSEDRWSVRFYYKPFIRFIWAGGIMMMVGGIFAIWGRARNKSDNFDYKRLNSG